MGGLSVIGAALMSLGIPKDSIVRYETAIKVGKYALIAHGTIDEITKAKEILGGTKPETLEHHSASEPAITH